MVFLVLAGIAVLVAVALVVSAIRQNRIGDDGLDASDDAALEKPERDRAGTAMRETERGSQAKGYDLTNWFI